MFRPDLGDDEPEKKQRGGLFMTKGLMIVRAHIGRAARKQEGPTMGVGTRTVGSDGARV